MVQDHEGPERFAAVLLFASMLLLPLFEYASLEQSEFPQRRPCKEAFKPVVKCAAHPLGQGDGEALFRTIDNLVENMTSGGQLEKVLAKPTSDLVPRREGK